MPAPLPEFLITQQQFDEYTAAWTEIANGSDPDPLRACFFPQGQLLTGAYLSIDDLIYLLSAVGTVTIKTRFAVRSVGGVPTFSVVLFGADSFNSNTTAYFIGTSTSEGLDDADAESGTGDPVPDCLATRWLTNWQGQTKADISQALFAGPYGTLRGYTFPFDDFMDTLFPLTNLSGETLRVNFALHQSYRPDVEDDTMTSTFGLVVDTAYPSAPALARASSLYYDVSMPCPATC